MFMHPEQTFTYPIFIKSNSALIATKEEDKFPPVVLITY